MAWSFSGASVIDSTRGVVFTFDRSNIFAVGWDLNPLAMQIGAGADTVRDNLSAARDYYLQPLMATYRTRVYPQSGLAGHPPEDDYSLYYNGDFQTWVQTGIGPVREIGDPNQGNQVRWSYHYATVPPEMYGLSNSGVQWWHDNVFNNSAISDPAAYEAKLIADWRAEYVRRGGTQSFSDLQVMEYIAAGTFPELGAGFTGTTSTPAYDPTTGYSALPSNTDPTGGYLLPPIPGSDVLSGSANVPNPADSGPASNNAFPISLGAPNVSVNMGAPIINPATGQPVTAATGPNWLLIAALAVGVYLVMEHK
jgi:hypothetical protein